MNTHTRIARIGLAALALSAVMSAPAWAAKKKPPSPKKHGPQPPSQPLGAPEIDPSLLAGGVLLLVGGTLVLTGRRQTTPHA
ncbi:MAG: hypothetical protein ACKVWV_08635 [Planctomycetota bacterium]